MRTLSWPLVFAIVFPARGRTDEPGTALAWRWTLHLFLWTGVLAGLWYLNRFGAVERALRSPWPIVHRVWLPLLAVPIYLIGWLSVGLWVSLRRVPVTAWPEVDAAWDDARQALRRADIDITHTPLFLILGPLPRELQAPLESLGAAALPCQGDTPFRVFAHAQGVYLVCDRLSRLGAPAQIGPGKSTPLQHLCQLLLRERAPRLPIEGIVLIVPFAATQTSADTRKATLGCQSDVRDLRHATGVEVPLYLAITGIDPMPDSQAAGTSTGWFQHFPPLPDLDPAEVMSMYEQGVDCLCLTQVRRATLARLQLDRESENNDGLSPALWDNIRLHQWLSALQTRRIRLAKLLAEGVQNDLAEPGMVAGCYLAPAQMTDADALKLTRTLCTDLLAHRDTVAWTDETALRDARERRRARLGFGLLCMIGMVVAVGVAIAGRL